MNKEYEVEFYKSLAKEIKPQGFKCFLYADEKDVYAWLCIITPNNSWLYVDEGELGGYNIVYGNIGSFLKVMSMEATHRLTNCLTEAFRLVKEKRNFTNYKEWCI